MSTRRRKPTPEPTPIQKLADETQEKLVHHIEANTTEQDARRETDRDARVAALVEQLEAEGKLPRRRSLKP